MHLIALSLLAASVLIAEEPAPAPECAPAQLPGQQSGLPPICEAEPNAIQPSQTTPNPNETYAVLSQNHDGQTLVFDDGRTFVVTQSMQQQAYSWAPGDQVSIRPSKKGNGWYKLHDEWQNSTVYAQLQAGIP